MSLLPAAPSGIVETSRPDAGGLERSPAGERFPLQPERISRADLCREIDAISTPHDRHRFQRVEKALLGSADRGPAPADRPGKLDQPVHRPAGTGVGNAGRTELKFANPAILQFSRRFDGLE